MKKTNIVSILLFAFISSIFFINKVDAYYTSNSGPVTNSFTFKNEADYIVLYKQMTLDGKDYETVHETGGTVKLLTSITPEVIEYEGFKSPEEQTVVIDKFDKTIITYLYERKKYALSIGNYDNVTTNTPSGEYYYGTQIHLVANPTNAYGSPFKKWSNGEVYADYLFTLDSDVSIKPLYGDPIIIEFEPDGGSPAPVSMERYSGEPIGELPVVEKNDCDSTEGSYTERNCTYVYEFQGWYLEPEFEHRVNEGYIPEAEPNATIRLYAKWNKIYFHNDQTVFDGTNMLDTEIALFSKENADKDFIVTFTLDEMAKKQVKRAAFFANIYEKGEPFPGTMFRYDNKFELVGNVEVGHKKTQNIKGFDVGQTFVLKRENGILSYSVNGGESFTEFNDYTSFNRYFDVTGTFGGEYDENGNQYRYFVGTLSNMTVELSKRKHYTVSFDANGGHGMMLEQEIPLDASVALTENAFAREGFMFDHWNTESDGSGVSYDDKEVVSGLGNEGDEIVLYAQWVDAPHYTVAFDANGGTGTMDNQDFVFGISQELSANAFTKDKYAFESWNTKADGTGTRYKNKESVDDLTTEDGATVTLYAQYERMEFDIDGDYVFDGNNNIDTEVNLYSEGNTNRDFDMSFDVVYVDPANATDGQEQPTIMNAKDETNTNSHDNRVPGFATRLGNNTINQIHMVSTWGTNNKDLTVPSNKVPIHFEYKRRDGVVTVQYSYDSFVSDEIEIYNQADWELNRPSPINVIFGSTYKDGAYVRFFKGTLRDIHVKVYEE